MLPLNYFAILVAALLYMAIGALWYSPLMFGNLWMKLRGIKTADMERTSNMRKDLNRKYIMTFISSIFAAFVLAFIIKSLLIQTPINGFRIGFLAWLGFAATAQFANWNFSGKPKELFFIDTGYPLVAYCIMGTLLAAWK